MCESARVCMCVCVCAISEYGRGVRWHDLVSDVENIRQGQFNSDTQLIFHWPRRIKTNFTQLHCSSKCIFLGYQFLGAWSGGGEG